MESNQRTQLPLFLMNIIRRLEWETVFILDIRFTEKAWVMGIRNTGSFSSASWQQQKTHHLYVWEHRMGSCVPLAFSKNRSTHKYGDTIPSLLRIILFCASYPRLTLNHFVNNFLFHFLKVFWSSSLITLFPYSYCLMKQ